LEPSTINVQRADAAGDDGQACDTDPKPESCTS